MSGVKVCVRGERSVCVKSVCVRRVCVRRVCVRMNVKVYEYLEGVCEEC